ncbi:hypothetical protein ACFX2B_043334 [Malus domestica]
MMPTPRWSPKPICFQNISPRRRIPLPLLIDTLCEVLRQIPNFGITQEEVLPELMLPEEVYTWLNEFISHIGGKKDLPEPSNFHVNMTYVLFAMFYPKHDQPATIKGDYLATEPMMAHVSVEEAGKNESGRIGLPKLIKKEPDRIYSDRMVFSCPSLILANHLKPI